MRRQSDPTFVLLTCDEGLTGFPLRIERVEALLETLLGRLAGVDGAPQFRVALLYQPQIAYSPKCPASGLVRRNVVPTNGRQ